MKQKKLTFLNLWENGNYGYDHTENHVEADKELVDGTFTLKEENRNHIRVYFMSIIKLVLSNATNPRSSSLER